MFRLLAKATGGLSRSIESVHLYGVSARGVQILGNQSADLVGTIGVRHRHACWAQWVIRLWLRARRSIPLESNREGSFDVLFCSVQVDGSILLIYRKETGIGYTVSRGLRFAMEVAICEGLP